MILIFLAFSFSDAKLFQAAFFGLCDIWVTPIEQILAAHERQT